MEDVKVSQQPSEREYGLRKGKGEVHRLEHVEGPLVRKILGILGDFQLLSALDF